MVTYIFPTQTVKFQQLFLSLSAQQEHLKVRAAFLSLRQWKLEAMGVNAVWQYVSKHSVSHKAPKPPLLVFRISFSSQILPSVSKLCPSQQARIPQDKLLKGEIQLESTIFIEKKKRVFCPVLLTCPRYLRS